MPDPSPPSDARHQAARSAPWWFGLAGRLLRPWIRINREPDEPTQLLRADLPVCYVTERHGLSDALILERVCRDTGLPSATANLEVGPLRRRFSLFSMARRGRRQRGGLRKRASETVLQELFSVLEDGPEQQDVQVVPVSIYVGRAPARPEGWFRVLFSENSVLVGRFRRMLAVLLNGRHTVVHFAQPVSLRDIMAESPDMQPARLARKTSRVFRVHFRRIRAAIIGPDLSHRRIVVDSVLASAPVRAAIADSAQRRGLSPGKAHKRAHKMAMGIAADYSHPVVRSGVVISNWLWNKLYDGVAMRHFGQARAAAPGHEVVYVPCHRSHADYLLLSYMLHVSGVVIPHIAAGANLDLPLLGSFLRRGGAFFLRRSFKGSALYSTIFKEYLAQLIGRGVPIEYFIEGGRSRTGRLLPPKGGMLSMTVRAYLRAPRRPVLFQPVYIGYEKLMEGNAYAGELSGKPKQKESWLGLLHGARKVLKQHYGNVALNFGEPIALEELLGDVPDDTIDAMQSDAKPAWFSSLVDTLARRIQVNINAAADVNDINLLALVLLAMPKHAMAEADLRKQLLLTRNLLTEQPYSSFVHITSAGPDEIIARSERMGWIERIDHPAGDVLRAGDEQAVLLSYFRNNVLHLTTCIAWVACCFLNNRRMSRSSILRLGQLIYPFIRSELFLRWDGDEFKKQLRATIDLMVQHGLLEARNRGRRLQREPGQADAAFQLRVLAKPLLQAFERYYIAVAALVTSGPGTLRPGELEGSCTSTAQRLSLLHERNAPEFFDKTLFRGFIRSLRQQKLAWLRDDGTLDYDVRLERVVDDAGVILSREVRHSILKITPSQRRDTTDGDDGGDAEADPQQATPPDED